MDESKRQEILSSAADFFREEIIVRHRNNIKELRHLKKFKYNPFTFEYLASYFNGSGDAESLAKAIFYPRALGTSINTTFGNQLQKFCNDVLGSVASLSDGLDIEFTDKIDGQIKRAQIKAGPNTLNKDDVKTVIDHFQHIKNLARTNMSKVDNSNLIVGVLYGTPEQLSSSYRKIAESYDVIIGEDFWHRLTGDKHIYYDVINTFSKVAKEEEEKSKDILDAIIKDLSVEIQNEFLNTKS